MLTSGMSLKSVLIVLILAGIGYVIGLPMGAMFGGEDAPPANAIAGNDSDDDSRPDSPAASASPRARVQSLTARIIAQEDWQKIRALLDQAKPVISQLSLDETRALVREQLAATRKSGTDDLLRLLFARWMALEPSAAWSAAESADEDHRLAALGGCLRQMCATDVLAAWRRAESVKNEQCRSQLLNELRRQVMESGDPMSTARKLVALSGKDRPTGLLPRVMEAWGKQNLADALAFAETPPVPDREEALVPLCQLTASIDRDAAVRLAATITDKKKATDAWRGVLGDWLMIDLEWCAGILEQAPLDQLDADIWDNVGAPFDMPPDALRRICDLLPEKQREAFCEKLFREADNMPLAETHRRMDAIGMTEDDGGAWAGKLATTLFKIEPDSTRRWAAALPPGRLHDSVMQQLIPVLARESPPDAITMLGSIADAEARSDAFGEVIGQWLRSDRPAATRWLQGAASSVLGADEKKRWLRFAGALP